VSAARLARALAVYAALVACACVFVHARTRIDPAPLPPAEARDWALDALTALASGETPPAAPGSVHAYRPAGPVFATAWWRGRPLVVRVSRGANLEVAVRELGRALAAETSVVGLRRNARSPLVHTLAVTRGRGPIVLGVPLLENLALVPLHDGLAATIDGESAYLTPDELRAEGTWDRGVPTPIPDLTIGAAVDGLASRLARELGQDAETLASRGRVERLRVTTLTREPYPRETAPTERALRQAAREGVEFLLRHMRPDGSYTYVYDGRTGRDHGDVYNVPRHAGTTYFLSLVGRLDAMPEARAGARRALFWLRSRARRCGGEDRWCIVSDDGRVELGSSALATIAVADYLAGGDDPELRPMLAGLTAFLRAQQRPDGELMHEYDLAADRPIDVQHLYYSGEAAFALVLAHEAARDPRDLAAARRVMRHLTGAGWSFFGSRYYYGEEHWTCIAAGAARTVSDTDDALDFCDRWASYNRVLQYGPGETPWPVSGAYGVGPVILPRLTPIASRTEAFVSTYELALHHGHRDTALRRQIERGLGALLRYRWSPGPTHLLAHPLGARGGIPGSPVDLTIRNDFVQHAGAAMIRWAAILRDEARR
jgi:hypothetical protein